MSRSISFGLAIALALAACGPRAGSGPAWPTRQDPEEDGGESLAPRESVATTAKADDDDDATDDDDDGDTKSAAKPAAETVEAPTVTPSSVPSTPEVEDEPITEELIIEIEDEE